MHVPSLDGGREGARMQDYLCGCRKSVPVSAGCSPELCGDPDCLLLGSKVPTVLQTRSRMSVWKRGSVDSQSSNDGSVVSGGNNSEDWDFRDYSTPQEDFDSSSVESVE